MRGINGRWEDGSGGAGRTQRITDDGEFVRLAEASYDVDAYHRLLEHAQACPGCVKAICPEGRIMWRAVKRREL